MNKILLGVALQFLSLTASAELVSHNINIDGVNIHYAESGSGPALILLHGLWGGTNEWAPVVERLAERHRVIAMDLPGFHNSDKPEVRYSNALLANHLRLFIEKMELNDVMLMGHAMGANLATYTAFHYPQTIRRLILVDGAGYRNPDRDLSQPPTPGMVRFTRTATGDTMESTRGLLERRVNDTSLVNAEWVSAAHAMWNASAVAIAHMLREGGDLTDDEMRQIEIPTLIVWGANDKVFSPDNAARVANDISGASVRIIADAGHLPQIEQPDAFLAAVLPFLAQTERSTTVDGVYERVSLINTRTGDSPEAANRKGLLILANGHYSMMTMNPDRRSVGRDVKVDDWPAQEQIDFYKEWLDVNAHSGRFEIDGRTLIWYRDISEDPREAGTVSRLMFESRADLLIISFSLSNGDVYEWVWRRVAS